MSEAKHMEDFGVPIVYLLKGVLYQHQERAWALLLQHRHKVKEYLASIGLDLHVNDANGYAFAKQKEIPDELEEVYPRLMQKRPLSYMPSLLCVMLRKRLLESDQQGTEIRTVISRDQIIESVRVFQGNVDTNEKKREDKVDSAVTRLVDYGFLIELKNEKDKYEVSRILEAYIDIDKLKEIQAKLETHTKGDSIEATDENGIEL